MLIENLVLKILIKIQIILILKKKKISKKSMKNLKSKFFLFYKLSKLSNENKFYSIPDDLLQIQKLSKELNEYKKNSGNFQPSKIEHCASMISNKNLNLIKPDKNSCKNCFLCQIF